MGGGRNNPLKSLEAIAHRAEGRESKTMPERNVQLTRATRGVLAELVDDPSADHHVTQLVSGTGLSAGEIYPVLARLEAVRWLESSWDPPTSTQQGWPRRRHYRLTADGLAMA